MTADGSADQIRLAIESLDMNTITNEIRANAHREFAVMSPGARAALKIRYGSERNVLNKMYRRFAWQSIPEHLAQILHIEVEKVRTTERVIRILEEFFPNIITTALAPGAAASLKQNAKQNAGFRPSHMRPSTIFSPLRNSPLRNDAPYVSYLNEPAVPHALPSLRRSAEPLIAAHVHWIRPPRPAQTSHREHQLVISGSIRTHPAASLPEVEAAGSEKEIFRPEHARIIDANLFTEHFVPGEVAILTVTIRLPQSRASGKWQGQAEIDPGKGPVEVLVEARGFKVISEPPPPIAMPEDRDTAPVTFELRILEARERWLHLLVTQTGCPVGELAINDFSAVGAGPVQHAARIPVRTLSEADLTLVVRDGRIEAYSPRDRASLSGVTINGFEYPTEDFRETLRTRLKALYDERADAEETARELQIVGVELAKSLPPDLIKMLRRPDIRSVMLRHEQDFDFPIELCYLDDPIDPFFVGDRIAICRWYMGVTNPPDVTAKLIGKVAFLKGTDDACGADENLLAQLYSGRTVTLARRTEVIEKLFKTSNFDLIHFTGHCRVDDEGVGGLELMDGSFLRLIDIGQLESERAFTKAQPFVMVNACASSQPYVALTNRDSFPHRFVTNLACAFVGTLWPVSGPVANEFAQLFYVELARKPIGRALLAAKAAIVQQDAERPEDEASPQRKLARQVAARSYCLFANPDLTLAQAIEDRTNT